MNVNRRAWTAVVAVAGAAVVMVAGCQSTNPETKGPQAAVAPERAGQAGLARAQVSPVAAAQASRRQLELVSEFTGPMVTGVTVSQDGRVFVSFPRWLDPVETTAAELRDGRLVPVPNAAMNRLDKDHPATSLVSVQSVVVDPANRLWLVDAGNVNFGKNLKDGPKLVAVDLDSHEVLQTIHFPASVVRPESYLNDIRFDLRRGEKGIAYLTDSSKSGENGIVVVDLATGQSWRKLDKDPSVLPAADFAPRLEGEPDQPMMTRKPLAPNQPLKIGSDGIALSPDGKTLYYRPLASHHLYSVPTDLLVDRNVPADQVASNVRDYGDVGFASDGLECDAQGRLYLTDYEHHAVRRGDPSAAQAFRPAVFVQDPRLIWPDTLAIGPDGYLYVTANQLDRQPQFHNGKDLRKPPYALFRVKTDSRPIREK
jgi:sugar lactone lactonase YvrE